MSNLHPNVPRLTALLDGMEMTPTVVARLVAVAYFQARVVRDVLLDAVVPRLPPLKRGLPVRVAARIGSDAIFDTSFLDDLGSLIASLEAQIDAGSHVYWHGDEHHTRGGYEAVFREPGVTELCHAVADLAMLRNTTVGALCAARGLRDAGTLLDD
ncbi:hypothetical protein [Roseovarius sp.]|uniref:hypothetical protein n=1 Tax=Roseovarius sp. TaxID=1486281 RepID=UPI000C3C1D28|nr:hypothetical protein [Roseovarius sp.]MAZ22105.1 hypothetical protein [Roseovarius sp.]